MFSTSDGDRKNIFNDDSARNPSVFVGTGNLCEQSTPLDFNGGFC